MFGSVFQIVKRELRSRQSEKIIDFYLPVNWTLKKNSRQISTGNLFSGVWSVRFTLARSQDETENVSPKIYSGRLQIIKIIIVSPGRCQIIFRVYIGLEKRKFSGQN